MSIGFESPASKIATSQAILSLAFRLNNEVNQGRITSEIFKHPVTVYTGSSGLYLSPAPELTNNDLEAGISNITIISLSASAITLDETLDEVFGDIKLDNDLNRHSLRVMVKQLRNAFAHNPWRAKWIIRPHYRNLYRIILDDGSEYTFDTTTIDGESIKPEQVGGLEFWIKVLQHCERLVSK